MKKLIILSLVGFFLLSGCGYQNDLGLVVTDRITIYEMEDFHVEKADSAQVIDDQAIIEEVVTIINAAKKGSGSVDMPVPEYRVDLAKRSIFLWLSESSGTVMDNEDTETIYTISRKEAERLKEILE